MMVKRGPKTKDPMARFMAKVDMHGPVPAHRPDLGPCWVWTAFLNHLGYGRLSATVDGRRSQVQAHRWIGWMNRKVFVPGKGYHTTDTHIMACVGTNDPLQAPRRTPDRPGPGTPRIHEGSSCP